MHRLYSDDEVAQTDAEPHLAQLSSGSGVLYLNCYVPVGAAPRQTIACSCNTWHFVAEGPAEMYGDHTVYQERTLKLLRLVPLGYMATSPDGNCLFNATSQCMSCFTREEMLQHPFRGQHLQAELRHKAAGLLRTDPVFEKNMSELQENVLQGYPHLRSEHCLHPEVPVSQLLASAIINDKA